MVEKNDSWEQENVFLSEFGLIVPAVLKCLFCADLVYPPGEKLALFTHFAPSKNFSKSTFKNGEVGRLNVKSHF